MALTFRTCTECGESHAVRADGRMSIHATREGSRCEEPAERTRSSGRPFSRGRDLSEIDEAFAVAADRRPRDPNRRRATDRGIYAVGRAQIVRGGLPGSKR